MNNVFNSNKTFNIYSYLIITGYLFLEMLLNAATTTRISVILVTDTLLCMF